MAAITRRESRKKKHKPFEGAKTNTQGTNQTNSTQSKKQANKHERKKERKTERKTERKAERKKEERKKEIMPASKQPTNHPPPANPPPLQKNRKKRKKKGQTNKFNKATEDTNQTINQASKHASKQKHTRTRARKHANTNRRTCALRATSGVDTLVVQSMHMFLPWPAPLPTAWLHPQGCPAATSKGRVAPTYQQKKESFTSRAQHTRLACTAGESLKLTESRSAKSGRAIRNLRREAGEKLLCSPIPQVFVGTWRPWFSI